MVGAAWGTEATDVTHYLLDTPTILVMGSEGSGLRTMCERACKDMLMISSGRCLATPLIGAARYFLFTRIAQLFQNDCRYVFDKCNVINDFRIVR